MELYNYTGTLSEIGNRDTEIVLGDIMDWSKPPVKITANKSMHKYLLDRSWTDDEEKYLRSNWVYDRCLILNYIEIPSDRPGWPAKVIASADPTRVSMDIVVFGPVERIKTSHPEPMSQEELERWCAFRERHNLYGIH